MNKTNTSWSQLKFKDVARFINGRAFKPSEWKKKGLPIIRIQNLNDANKPFNYFDGEFEEKYLQLSGFTVQPGDVLITMMGTVGRVAVVPEDIGKSIISSHLLKIEVDKSRCNPIFLKHMILTDYVQHQFSVASHGAVMGGLNTGIVKETRIFLPPINLQKKFALAADKIRLTKDKQRESTSEINELFHTLMHKAFRGELVRNVGENTLEREDARTLDDFVHEKNEK